MKVSDFMHEMRTTSAVLGRSTGVYVTFEGEGAFTDGKRINLPSMDMSAELTIEQVKAMRGYVDHEAGHVRHSDMPRILDFYKRCINNDKEGLKNLHNCVEDVWMEGAVCDDYVGAYKNLKQTNELGKGKELKCWSDAEATLAEARAKGNTEVTLEDIKARQEEMFADWNHDMIGMGIKACDSKYLNEYGSAKKVLDLYSEDQLKWIKKWAEEAEKCTNTEQAITLAKSIDKIVKENPNLEDMDPEDFDPQAGEGEPEGEPGDVTDGEAEEGTGQGRGKGEKGEMPWDLTLEGSLCGEGDTASGAIGQMDGPLKGGYRVFSTTDDRIYKRGSGLYGNSNQSMVDSVEHHLYQEVKDEISSDIKTMKNKLRRSLMAKMQKRTVHGREYGRLDNKRLVAASNFERNVYKQQSDIYELDTAVTLLIDLSGSMYNSNKNVVARDCAVALSECLDGAGMEFKVVGFSNKSMPDGWNGEGQYHRIERLDTTVFKDFGMPLRKCRASVAKIHDAVGGNNSDYDFIANELSALKKRDEKRKVLFVLSDGHPAHQGSASSSEIIRHCKLAIKAGQKDGVECVGIGIKDKAVEGIYDDCVVVQNVNELSSTVFNKLTNLLLK
mgnify:FL=1